LTILKVALANNVAVLKFMSASQWICVCVCVLAVGGVSLTH